MPHRLRFPAPRRCSYGSITSTHPYSQADVLTVLASGGWFDFQSGQHDFESDAVRRYAGEAQRTLFALQS